MSGTDPNDRSAAEIERDVERTRARLTGTVEELKDRVSPSQLADQAMDWLRGSGGRQFINNLGSTLRDNPMPVMLVAAGIGWMALSGGRERSPRRRSDADRDDGAYAGVYGGADYAAGYAGESSPPGTYAGQGLRDESGASLGERASEAAGGLRDKAADLADRASGAASSAVQGATDAARSVADSVASGSRQATRRAGEAWHGATDRAYRYGAGAGRSVSETLETQPLLLGALGFAVGAALGALVPHSAAEDRLMGESRDRVADRLSTLAGEAYGKARAVVGEQAARAQENLGEAYGQARERVAGSGVSASEGASALGGVARDLRQAVERTAQDAVKSVREATAKPEGEPDRKPPGGRPAGGSATGMPPARSGPESGGPV